MMGKPGPLDRSLVDRVASVIRSAGVDSDTAAVHEGVSRKSHKLWVARGLLERERIGGSSKPVRKSEEPFVYYVTECERAWADVVVRNGIKVQDADDVKHAEWWLDRKAGWTSTSRVEVDSRAEVTVNAKDEFVNRTNALIERLLELPRATQRDADDA